MLFLFSLHFIINLHLIFADRTTFQSYYSPKSIDEVRYIITEFEKYILHQNPQFERKGEYLSTYNRNELIDYTVHLVNVYCPNFNNIDIFTLNIKIFDSKLSIDSIIENGERQFLIKWAINAEKYKRRATETSHLIGGLIDYAQYMKLSELRSYIRATIFEYPNQLGIRSTFDQEILNIKPYLDSIFQYIREAPLDVLRYWINNLEDYLIKVYHLTVPFGHEDALNPDNHKSVLQKNMYYVLKQYKELLEIESFIQVLDYKNMKYMPLSLEPRSELSIRSISLGCEEYNRKQKNLSKSFRGLHSYYNKIPINNLKAYALNIISEYPELSNYELINDLSQNNKRLNYGKVKDNVNSLSRKDLITYILNSKTIEHITNKFDEDLNVIFHLKDNKLREMLINISKRNPSLQTQINMVNTVKLNNGSLPLWLEQLPQNILADIAFNLTKIYAEKETLSSKVFSDSSEEIIIKRIIELAQTYNITSPKQLELKLTNNNGPIYNGRYHYFKAINKETLFIWIKTFESHHRQKRKLTSIIGGITNTKIDKKYYIGKLFYYLEKYPQYKDPKAFDTFVGFDIPHEDIYKKNTQELLNTAVAFNNYHKRVSPNLQYSVNLYTYYNPITKAMSNINYLYFYIFKMMAIYPELNLHNITTQVSQEPDYTDINIFFDYLYGNRILEVALLVQRHHNNLNEDKDTRKLEEYDDNTLKHYIKTKYYEDKQLQIDFQRLVFGQSDYLYWNYEEFFYRQVKEDLVTFAERMETLNQFVTNYDFKNMNKTELEKYLIAKMSQLEELHDWELFDLKINYVKSDNVVSSDYIKMLEGLPRYKLMQFTLVVMHLNYLYNCSTKYLKVFSFIVSATNNELIRYICKGLYFKYKIGTYNDLFLYSRLFFLDYGEQSILDIVEFV